MAEENIYTVDPTRHAMVLTMDTKALVVDKLFALSELHGPVVAKNELGEEGEYVRILVGDDVKAVQGDRFTAGSSLCVRLGDRTLVCRYLRFTNRVTDSSRGSRAARTGAYAGLVDPYAATVIPEGSVLMQVPGPFEAQPPREGEDMYGAVTWPPTRWREVHLARLWTVTAAGKVVKDRKFTYVPVF